MFSRYHMISFILVAGSAFALAGALVSQYVVGLHPCPLCIYQRYPYVLLFLIGGLLIWKPSRIILWCALGLLCIEITLAFYHMGIEYHWWTGFTSCSADGDGITSIEALREQIMNSPVVRCDEPAFVFILSMAGWNVVYATAMMIGVLYYAFGNRDK